MTTSLVLKMAARQILVKIGGHLVSTAHGLELFTAVSDCRSGAKAVGNKMHVRGRQKLHTLHLCHVLPCHTLHMRCAAVLCVSE